MAKEHFKEFNIKESPFHEEYGGKKEPMGMVRIHNDKIKLLKKHFNSVYGKGGMTIGVERIIDDYMDRLCLKKGIFNHMEVVMLIPKSDDIDDLQAYSEIIGLINTESDFNKNFNHTQKFKDSGVIYELRTFERKGFHYVLEMFKNSIDSCAFKTSKEDLESFESFKQRQAELYPDLDMNNCYFVRFPLNNYMDNFNHGKSVHYKSWKNNHLGGYVLVSAFENEEKFLLVDWYYISEILSQIRIDFQFVPKHYFMETIMSAHRFDDKSDNEFYHDEDKRIISEELNVSFDKEYMDSFLEGIENDLIARLGLVRSLRQGNFWNDD